MFMTPFKIEIVSASVCVEIAFGFMMLNTAPGTTGVVVKSNAGPLYSVWPSTPHVKPKFPHSGNVMLNNDCVIVPSACKMLRLAVVALMSA